MRIKSPDGTLPVRNLPSPVFGQETEKVPPPYYLEWAHTQLLRHMKGIEKHLAALSRTVEEYAGESRELFTGETELSAIADYARGTECITSVLITGPVNSVFVLWIGDRIMNLSTDATGKCLLAPVLFKLGPGAQRRMSANASGPWFLQLSGYVIGVDE